MLWSSVHEASMVENTARAQGAAEDVQSKRLEAGREKEQRRAGRHSAGRFPDQMRANGIRSRVTKIVLGSGGWTRSPPAKPARIEVQLKASLFAQSRVRLRVGVVDDHGKVGTLDVEDVDVRAQRGCGRTAEERFTAVLDLIQGRLQNREYIDSLDGDVLWTRPESRVRHGQHEVVPPTRDRRKLNLRARPVPSARTCFEGLRWKRVRGRSLTSPSGWRWHSAGPAL